MSLKRCLLCTLLLLLVGLTLLWAMHPQLLRAMSQWLDIGQHPQRADYVMVLNGGEETRPFAAAALVKAGLARHVLVAEVAASPEVADHIHPPYHEINRLVLLNRGVPKCDITILPASAATTYDEARALAAFLEDRPEVRVLVVTSDLHTRRSRWVFARTLADRAGQVLFVSAPTDEFSMDRWWRDEAGFVAIAAEYFKLAFYVVCHGYVGYWLAACAGLVLVAAWIRLRESTSPPSAG